MCKKPLLPPEDMGKAELHQHRLLGMKSVDSLLHTGNDPFSEKRKSLSQQIVPSLLPAKPPASPMATSSKRQPLPAQGTASTRVGVDLCSMGVGHHRKNISRVEAGKDSYQQEQPHCQGQREPEGGHSVAGGFSLLPQTEGFILEWHRGFSVLCLFQESLHGTTVGADTCVCPFGFEPFLPAREFLRK